MGRPKKVIQPIEEKIEEKQVEEKEVVFPTVDLSLKPIGPKWIKVTQEQLMKLQGDGLLIGYNPATGEALIK